MNESPVSCSSDPTLLRWFGWLVAVIAVAAFSLMTAMTLLGAAARYLGLPGLEWTFEISGILFLWTSFFGVIVAELRRENVAFTVLFDRLGSGSGRVVALLCSVLMLWLAFEFTRSGLAFASRSGAAPTPLLRLPRLVQIFPFVAFAAGIGLITLARITQDLLERRAR